FFVASLFPYLDLDQHDPVTGKTDGILARLTPDQRPKIFYTHSSGEYWGGGRAAALTHTTLDGRDDAKVPDNVRIYLIAGTQHVPGGYLPSQGPGQQKPHGNEYAWAERALLGAMGRCVRESAAPPPSAHWRIRRSCRARVSNSRRSPACARRSPSRPAIAPISKGRTPRIRCRYWSRRSIATATSSPGFDFQTWPF